MRIGWHRQHLNIAVGELQEAVGVIRQPEILLLTPLALLWQEIKYEVIELFLRRADSRVVRL